MIHITPRPYLFVDETLVDRHEGTEIRLHTPKREGAALRFDAPWEGPIGAYFTIVDAGDQYLMYYRAGAKWSEDMPGVTCVAESPDGVTWTRPNLWKYDYAGSCANNIIWMAKDNLSQNIAPFIDSNPNAEPEARFKALGGVPEVGGLYALASHDGFDWHLLSDKPVMSDGELDSLNTVFWDTELGCYVLYYRKWEWIDRAASDGIRSVARALSDDFMTWHDHTMLDFGEGPLEQFYTNAIRPYQRDPGLYLGFPKRLMPFRKRHPQHPEKGISDAVMIASRDGINFPRRFREAFVRPGLDQRNWTERNLMFAPGMIQTSPTEYSVYWSEHFRHADHYVQRGTIRIDGFASLHADMPGGTMTSVPIIIKGDQLVLNMSTSAAGCVTVELLDESEAPIDGFSAADCDELYGDDIERTVMWSGSPDISRIKGETVKLKITLADADIYSISCV
jgi:hypothetical protein